MRCHSRLVSILCLSTLIFATLAMGADPSSRKTYKHLVVQNFDSPDATDFPPDFGEALRLNLVRHLQQAKRFEKVTTLEKGEQWPSDTDLVLCGKITRFTKGNRAARYIQPGAGQTVIKASISFTDPATSQIVLSRDVSGRVVMGVFGGDSKGATNGLAKDVAKAAKKSLP